jgi:WD40 repeat protein/serine/threonine protein kinase
MSQIWNVGNTILDLYKVTEVLGEGGFGKVYKVRHQGWNVDLAVKVPKAEVIAAAGGVENFAKEAETWVNLGLHPHIVSCYYVRQIENIPTVFAEYLAGGNLHEWIESRRLYTTTSVVFQTPLQRILDVAIQFAWGLHYAHEQGLIHQDVKPLNVMMTPDGGVKVTDFGLARGKFVPTVTDSLKEEGVSAHHSLRATKISGTPAYCSPEQLRGEQLSRRADLWSWAVSILEMFNGDCTWRSGTIAATLLENYLESGSEDSSLPQMPESLAELLRTCFQEDPEERPYDMSTVAFELQKIYWEIFGKNYPRAKPKTVQEDADNLNNKALSLLDLGNQVEALHLWKQALQIQPHHPESTYNQGLILWRREVPNLNFYKVLLDYQKLYPDILTEKIISWTLDELMRAPSRDSALILQACIVRRLPEEAPDLFLHPEIKKFYHYLEFPNITDAELISALEEVRQRQSHIELWYRDWLISLIHLERNDCVTAVKLLKKHRENSEIKKALEEALGSFSFSLRLLRIFSSHWDAVTAINFSENDNFFLSGSQDATVKLWQITNKKCLHTLRGHKKKITSVCCSPDGEYIASASEDRTVRLWHGKTYKHLHTIRVLENERKLDGNPVFINSVCFSPNSQNILTFSNIDNFIEVQLWAIHSRQRLQNFIGCEWITFLNIDSQPTLFIKYYERYLPDTYIPGTIELVNAITGKLLCNFTTPDGSRNLYYGEYRSSNNRFIFSIKQTIDTDVYPQLFDTISDSSVRILPSITTKEEQRYFWLGIKTNSKFFIAGSELRDSNTGRCLFTFGDCNNDVISSTNSKSLIAASVARDNNTGHLQLTFGEYNNGVISSNDQFSLFAAGNKLHLWEIKHSTKPYVAPYQLSKVQATENLLEIQLRCSRQLVQAQFSLEQGRYMEAAQLIRQIRAQPDYQENEQALKIWKQLYVHLPRRKYVKSWSYNFAKDIDWNSVCISNDNQHAFIGREYIARLSGLSSLDPIFGLEGYCGTGSVFSKDSQFILAWYGGYGHDWSLNIWDVVSRQHILTINSPGHRPISGDISVDNRLILSGSDNSVKLWDVATGQCLRTYQTRGNAVCFSPDGRFTLFGSKNIQLWDIARNRKLRTLRGHQSPILSVCFSLDGRFALSGSGYRSWIADDRHVENVMKLWDIVTGICLMNFVGHELGIVSVSLSADNRFALSGSYDGTVKLWDTSTGVCLQTFKGVSYIQSACLSQDGQYILAAGQGAKLWVLDWELEDCQSVDWQEGARPYLENFLTSHISYLADLTLKRVSLKEEIKFALTRCDKLVWTDSDFSTLLHTLGCAGYGFLHPDTIRQELDKMAENGSSSYSSINKLMSKYKSLATILEAKTYIIFLLEKITYIELLFLAPINVSSTFVVFIIFAASFGFILPIFGTVAKLLGFNLFSNITFSLIHFINVLLFFRSVAPLKFKFVRANLYLIYNENCHWLLTLNAAWLSLCFILPIWRFNGIDVFLLWLTFSLIMINGLIFRYELK